MITGISLEGISHRYKGSDRLVLDDVTLVVSVGQAVAIRGPSGSGKSTLLSIIGQLLTPTSGSVTFLGDGDGSSRSRRADQFAWVLQNSACLEARTAIENVALVRVSQGDDRHTATSVAQDALARVGLADRADQVASLLSGGELQRMTVARALAARTTFVLADEPTGQLDTANSAEVTAALISCARSGQAVIVATHDPAVAKACDRVFDCRDGKLSEVAP